MKSNAVRIIVGFSIPILLLSGILYLYNNGSPVPCQFYQLTGLYCAGCGSGRAAGYILHGQLYKAFRCNMLLFILGIPCGAILVHEYLRFVFPSLKLRGVVLSQRTAYVFLSTLILFWILRNIPVFYFLAPQY